jgi:streptogramin lyase
MMAGANGIAATADGSVVFIGGWAEKNLTRIDRRGGEAKVDVVPVEIFTDNLTWTGDRSAVVAAGSYGIEVADIFHCFKSDNMICAHPSQVVRMDAESLAVDVVVAYDSDTMGSGTTGLEVDGEMWVSSVRDSGVNRFEPGA